MKKMPEYELVVAGKDGHAEDDRWMLRKDGRRFWAVGVLIPLRNENKFVAFAKVLRNRTDIKEQLESSQRQIERLQRANGGLPKSATDFPDAPELLSLDPKHADYLRFAADSPLGTAGAGGEWPNHIGALTPAPAPPEGDWFTRLRQRWLAPDRPATNSGAERGSAIFPLALIVCLRSIAHPHLQRRSFGTAEPEERGSRGEALARRTGAAEVDDRFEYHFIFEPALAPSIKRRARGLRTTRPIPGPSAWMIVVNQENLTQGQFEEKHFIIRSNFDTRCWFLFLRRILTLVVLYERELPREEPCRVIVVPLCQHQRFFPLIPNQATDHRFRSLFRIEFVL